MTDSSPPFAPKVFIKSFGCQMNVYDSLRMGDTLSAEGFVESDVADDADLVLLNTCHIRERAAEKIFSELGRLAQIKRRRQEEGGSLTIGVAGCVAQAEGAEIIRRQPGVDLVIGPQAYHRLPTLLQEARRRPGVIDTSFPAEDKLERVPAPSSEAIRKRGVTAFVTIQEGCDKFCSFCVVPYTRGAESSRRPEAVLAEIRQLAEAGVRDVSLLGQNVNAYSGVDDSNRVWTLGRLMKEASALNGVARIRYATSHPLDMADDLIEAHGSEPSVMPFLHLPIQSGSDRILQAMNRRHTVRDYLRVIERIRSVRPDIALSSDFIVGFPGETRSDFAETLAVAREVGFAQAYSFKFSPRPGTPAAEAPDQLAESEMKERLAELQALLESSKRKFNRAVVGSVQEVLFEKTGRHPGQIIGKTPYMQAVHCMGPETLIGELRRVEIVACEPNSLAGRILGPTEAGP